MRLYFIILLLLITTCLVSSCGISVPEAKVSIHVVDEDGNPIGGAKVTIGFQIPKQGIKDINIAGMSDSSGRFSASNKTMDSIGFRVGKEGYYESYGGH